MSRFREPASKGLPTKADTPYAGPRQGHLTFPTVVTMSIGPAGSWILRIRTPWNPALRSLYCSSTSWNGPRGRGDPVRQSRRQAQVRVPRHRARRRRGRGGLPSVRVNGSRSRHRTLQTVANTRLGVAAGHFAGWRCRRVLSLRRGRHSEDLHHAGRRYCPGGRDGR